ncbi:BTAD domain-containing putative transcriptional regulator [Streptomyces albus subsp. chlorinus]|uniref:BTAD domain-containing putative transcriptional regulator n=1 Tax=Streptomyces albus TaxID=1888 RepID=UPI003D12A3AE
MPVEFGVLGPVASWDSTGAQVRLGGPRHREVLARLLVARRRVVPVSRLVADLWEEPPAGAVGAVRTFVAALRQALEPDRPPRTPSRLLATEGPGYVLRPQPGAVDAWRFEEAVERAAGLGPGEAAPALAEALATWRGPAYADFPSAEWARAERARLTELRLHAVERRAEALIRSGAAREAVPDLDAHVTEHPWREDGWQLLATALYRADRQGDALTVLRRARHVLADQLGVEPGPGLGRLEQDVLRQAERLEGLPDGTAGGVADGAAGGVWSRAAAAYESAVPARSRARLETTAGLLRDLAVTSAGGLGAARQHRAAAVAAAERTGDVELTARVIGVYDVPAVWTRADDVDEARAVVKAAQRVLARLPEDAPDAVRARLLAAVAVESRGDALAEGALPLAADGPVREPWRLRAEHAALEAEGMARRLNDAALLAFALNGSFMQMFRQCGLAAGRDAVGTELVALSRAHGLVSAEVLGRLIRLQALSGLGDLAGADAQAAAVDSLAERHERPLAAVFTAWYRALRAALSQDTGAERDAYAQAVALLDGCGMPGFAAGLPALVRLAPVLRAGALPDPDAFAGADWGPYGPWVRPLLLLGAERPEEAREALRTVPRPPHDLMQEALWCLLARAAALSGEARSAARAAEELAPARHEQSGAAAGLLTFGPVTTYLTEAAATAAAGDH